MRKLLCGSAFLLAATWMHGGAAAADTAFVIANNTPRFVASAHKIGDVDPAKVIDVTLWLNLHNRAALDSLVQREYDRTSPLYHHFISREALGRLIGPSDDEFASVVKFAESHNLTLVAHDKYNMFARVRGTVDAVQKAFSVKLANVAYKGKTLRVNLNDPTIDDPAGAHVMAVSGLDDMKYEHFNIAQSATPPGVKATAAAGAREFGQISNVCFAGTTTQTFTSGGADPTGTFKGNLYTQSPGACGYTPLDIQAAYGLTSLYNSGLNGAGQTIVILDWCGEESITSDANAFSAKFGLPALTSSNFSIVNYPGPSDCAAPDAEINIDVEWAHAIAPGANITLLVPPSATFSDVDAGLLYIVENDIGNVSSNSYGSPEADTPTTVLALQDAIVEAGAAEGISMAFSSGDGGDYTGGDPTFAPTVITPADSAYAVAVGGISLSLNKTDSILWQGGWGTDITLISEPGFVFDPSINFGFDFGSGGGTSAVFAKPSYQKGLPGKFRKLPDISWLADPFTGGVIAISNGFSSAPTFTVYGGTSLAAPMFSGLWAIANQAAGGNLGQASPVLYAAPSSAITDIVPVGSTTNVTGVLKNDGTVTKENAASLAQPLEYTRTYISALWDYPLQQGLAYVITFGTDTGLNTRPGWDDVTGLGVANPAALIGYVQSNQ